MSNSRTLQNQPSKENNNEGLRAAAHKAMDAYLDAGGPADFLILSKADHDRNWESSTRATERAARIDELENIDYPDSFTKSRLKALKVGRQQEGSDDN